MATRLHRFYSSVINYSLKGSISYFPCSTRYLRFSGQTKQKKKIFLLSLTTAQTIYQNLLEFLKQKVYLVIFSEPKNIRFQKPWKSLLFFQCWRDLRPRWQKDLLYFLNLYIVSYQENWDPCETLRLKNGKMSKLGFSNNKSSC